MAHEIKLSRYQPSQEEVGRWQQPGEIPFWRAVLIFFLASCLLVVLYAEISLPINRRLAVRNLNRGDAAVVAQQYDRAISEYQQASARDKTLQIADDRRQLAEIAKTDPLRATPLFEAVHATAQLTKLGRATREFSSPPEALVVGVSLLQQGDAAYAVYALEKALQLDPNYLEAKQWLEKAKE